MKRTEAKNIGQIIDDLLKKENLDVALDPKSWVTASTATPSSAMSRTG